MATRNTGLGLLHTQIRNGRVLYKVARVEGESIGRRHSSIKSQRDSRSSKTETGPSRMRAYRSQKLPFAVVVLLCVTVSSEALGLGDLLERVSQISDKLHSLSSSLTNDLNSHFPPMGKIILRPSMCHTSSLQTPNDKEQALRVPESELLALARSLLVAWSDPLVALLNEAPNLVHPEKGAIYSKTKELQEHSNTLSSGLDHLTNKMGPSSQVISSLPFSNDPGNDKNSRLANFHFLLSCFRRDSHKIDSFLKVLRCRAAKMRPEMC